MDTTGAQPSLAVKHSRPDASWWPYSDLSPFDRQVAGDALMLPNCAPIFDSLAYPATGRRTMRDDPAEDG